MQYSIYMQNLEDASILDLNDTCRYRITNLTGLKSIVNEFQTYQRLLSDGVVTNGQNQQIRNISFNIMVIGETPAEFLKNYNDFRKAMAVGDESTFVVSTAELLESDAEVIAASVVTRVDNITEIKNRKSRYAHLAVSLVAHDPLFKAVPDVRVDLQTLTNVNGFSSKTKFLSPNVGNRFGALNDGKIYLDNTHFDVDGQLEVTIEPLEVGDTITGVRLLNETTGAELNFGKNGGVSVGANQKLYIDTITGQVVVNTYDTEGEIVDTTNAVRHILSGSVFEIAPKQGVVNTYNVEVATGVATFTLILKRYWRAL